MEDILKEFGAEDITLEEARKIVAKSQKPVTFSLKTGKKTSLSEVMIKSTLSSSPERMPWQVVKWTKDAVKKALPLFSFCVDGKVTALVLDVEKSGTMQRFLEALEDFAYVAYYSASSELEKQRFRVIIPMTEPVPANEFDFCKDRLHKMFKEMADIHSFESKRFFFMPSKLTGEYREPNVIIQHDGASFDFYANTGFNGKDKMQMTMDEMKRQRQVEIGEKDVLDDERVQYYLSTDFPQITGNGDSASSLYTAITVCLAHDDENALEEVLDKARREMWTEKELERKIKDARRFLKI